MSSSGRSTSRRRSPSDEEAGEIPEHDPAPGIGARHSSQASSSNNGCLSSYASLANLEPPSTLFRQPGSAAGSNNNSNRNESQNRSFSGSNEPRGGRGNSGARSSFRGGGRGHEGRGRLSSRSNSFESAPDNSEYGGKRDGVRGGRGGRGGGRFPPGRGGGQRIGGGRSPAGVPATSNPVRRLSLQSSDSGPPPRIMAGERFKPLPSSPKEEFPINFLDGPLGGTGRGGACRFWRGGGGAAGAGRFERRRNSFDSSAGGSVDRVDGGGRDAFYRAGGGRESFRGGGRFSRGGPGRGRFEGNRGVIDGKPEIASSAYGPMARGDVGRGPPRDLVSRGGRGREADRGRFSRYTPPVELTRTSSVSVVSNYTSIIAGDAGLRRDKESSTPVSHSDSPSCGTKRQRESMGNDGGIAQGNSVDSPPKKILDDKGFFNQNNEERHRRGRSIDSVRVSVELSGAEKSSDIPRRMHIQDHSLPKNEPGNISQYSHKSVPPSPAPSASSQAQTTGGNSQRGKEGDGRPQLPSQHVISETRPNDDRRPRFDPKPSNPQRGAAMNLETHHSRTNLNPANSEPPGPSTIAKKWVPSTLSEKETENVGSTDQSVKIQSFSHYGPSERESGAGSVLQSPMVPEQHVKDSYLSLSTNTSIPHSGKGGGPLQFSGIEPNDKFGKNVHETPTGLPLNRIPSPSKDKHETLFEPDNKFEEVQRASPRFFGRHIVGARGPPGGRARGGRDDGGRHQLDMRNRGAEEGRGRSSYRGRSDSFMLARGNTAAPILPFGGGSDVFAGRGGESFGARGEFAGRGRGFGRFGRSGGRGRPDFGRGGPLAISSDRFIDSMHGRGPNPTVEHGRRIFDEPPLPNYPIPHQSPPLVSLAVKSQDNSQSVVTDYSSIATSLPPMKPLKIAVKEETKTPVVKTKPESPEPPRSKTPPPEPRAPSAVVLALTRLADMEAEMEFAYAKHMLLKAKQRNLRAQFRLLEKLPIGVEAVQDDLEALRKGAENTVQPE